MKYIRTNTRIFEIMEKFKPQFEDMILVPNEGLTRIIAKADTIEELCDEFVCIYKNGTKVINNSFDYVKSMCFYNNEIFGAIWTDKGLIYVAKMNDKGELELL